jgi:hypothetical protein
MRRRSLLQRCGALSTSTVVFGSTMARPNTRRNGSLRVRRPRENALSKRELVALRRSAIERDGAAGSVRDGAVATPKLEDGRLVAYNLTVVDGVPNEYFGTLVESHEATTARTTVDPVDRIHDRADDHLESDGTTGNQSASGSTDEWTDWTKVGKTDGDVADDSGNTHGYTIKFKTNPDDGSEYVTETRSRLDPGSNTNDSRFLTSLVTHRNEWSTFAPVNANMHDTKPLSDVGSSTRTMGLSINSERVV